MLSLVKWTTLACLLEKDREILVQEGSSFLDFSGLQFERHKTSLAQLNVKTTC